MAVLRLLKEPSLAACTSRLPLLMPAGDLFQVRPFLPQVRPQKVRQGQSQGDFRQPDRLSQKAAACKCRQDPAGHEGRQHPQMGQRLAGGGKNIDIFEYGRTAHVYAPYSQQ